MRVRPLPDCGPISYGDLFDFVKLALDTIPAQLQFSIGGVGYVIFAYVVHTPRGHRRKITACIDLAGVERKGSSQLYIHRYELGQFKCNDIDRAVRSAADCVRSFCAKKTNAATSRSSLLSY